MQEELAAIWREIEETAVSANLDPTKFTDTHREIVAQIVAFLQTPPPNVPEDEPDGWRSWLPLGKNGNGKRPSSP